MLRCPLNSEATNTNGAVKPCQRPSQKPATPSCSIAVSLNGLGLGAHPARMISSSTNPSKAKEGFILFPPTPRYEAQAQKVSKAQLTMRGAENKSPNEMRVQRVKTFENVTLGAAI